ncbi:MAG: hypothetical protein JWM00_80 [Candidatus Saccharibacteria bacterium]|nr:hypothetical protein [Candidatus Saccharibacteria bacterium]
MIIAELVRHSCLQGSHGLERIVHMSEQTIDQDNGAGIYDLERARLFKTRAFHRKNLPHQYRPEEPFDLGEFAETLIHEFVEGSTPENPDDEKQKTKYNDALAQAAFARLFLEGETDEKLQQITAFNTKARKLGGRAYALDVARIGARFLTEKLNATAEVVPIDQISEVEILEDYRDLDDVVKRFHEEQRMDRGTAQALLVLFELNTSHYPIEKVSAALTRVREDLFRRINLLAMQREGVIESAESKRLDEGLYYMRSLVGSPRAGQPGRRLKIIVGEKHMKNEKDHDAGVVRNHVFSYLGNALEELYPLKSP